MTLRSVKSINTKDYFMKKISLGFIVCLFLSSKLFAQDSLQEFDSDEGMRRFASSSAKVDFFSLANQFESQNNGLFCGPATAVMVLNAFRLGKSASLPKDMSQVTQQDKQFFEAGFDPSVARYSQNTVFIEGAKERAFVFGKLSDPKNKETRDYGFQLAQLDNLFQKHGLKSKMQIVDDKAPSEDHMKAEIIENLKNRGDYVVINYHRPAVGQKGGGHISPLGAYDKDSDSFLVMDVNPTRAKWVWIKSPTLFSAMRTKDTSSNRGYLLLSQ